MASITVTWENFGTRAPPTVRLLDKLSNQVRGTQRLSCCDLLLEPQRTPETEEPAERMSVENMFSLFFMDY